MFLILVLEFACLGPTRWQRGRDVVPPVRIQVRPALSVLTVDRVLSFDTRLWPPLNLRRRPRGARGRAGGRHDLPLPARIRACTRLIRGRS